MLYGSAGQRIRYAASLTSTNSGLSFFEFHG